MPKDSPVALAEGVEGEPPPGMRRFTKKELRVASKITNLIVKAAASDSLIINWTTKCINQYDLPGYPPNSAERLQMFKILLEMSEKVLEAKPPPISTSHIRHLITWEGQAPKSAEG